MGKKNSHMEHKRCSLKRPFIRGACLCVGNEGYTIKQPKCWKNHPFPALRSEAFKCLRRVCGSPSRAIAGHPYFSITLCTSHENHNICGTYFTALSAVATRARENGSEELKLSSWRQRYDNTTKMRKRAMYSLCKHMLYPVAKLVSLADFVPNSDFFLCHNWTELLYYH